MRIAAIPAAAAVCAAAPLFFGSPASTVATADETAALALVLGPGDHYIGPESIRVSGIDTLAVTVSCCRPLLPPRNPGVIRYTPLPEGARFLLIPGEAP
jgi:hypothetical protein